MNFLRGIKKRILGALKQGWTPAAVCWSAAWGVTVGVFPIYGVTTATLGVMGLVWKLNHSVMQGFNYLMSPVKFALIIPYIRLGEWMFRAESVFSLSIPEFTRRFRAAPLRTFGEFGVTFLHAIAGWMVTVPFLLLFSWLAMKVVLRAGESTRAQIQEATSS